MRVISPWLAAVFLALWALPAHAEARGGEARLSLIAAEAVHGGAPVLAGLRMEIAEGWKTYWRKPGDSGIAPRFDWSGSQNVASVDVLWPVPERFDAPDDITFGYEHEVVWPLLVHVVDPAKPAMLHLKFSYGVCSNICVPGEADLSLSLSPHAAIWSKIFAPHGDLVRHALARVPTTLADPAAVTLRVEAGAKPRLLVRYVTADGTPPLIVEGPGGIWFGTPAATRQGAAVDYTVPVEIQDGASLSGAELTLTFAGPHPVETRCKLE